MVSYSQLVELLTPLTKSTTAAISSSSKKLLETTEKQKAIRNSLTEQAKAASSAVITANQALKAAASALSGAKTPISIAAAAKNLSDKQAALAAAIKYNDKVRVLDEKAAEIYNKFLALAYTQYLDIAKQVKQVSTLPTVAERNTASEQLSSQISAATTQTASLFGINPLQFYEDNIIPALSFLHLTPEAKEINLATLKTPEEKAVGYFIQEVFTDLLLGLGVAQPLGKILFNVDMATGNVAKSTPEDALLLGVALLTLPTAGVEKAGGKLGVKAAIEVASETAGKTTFSKALLFTKNLFRGSLVEGKFTSAELANAVKRGASPEMIPSVRQAIKEVLNEAKAGQLVAKVLAEEIVTVGKPVEKQGLRAVMAAIDTPSAKVMTFLNENSTLALLGTITSLITAPVVGVGFLLMGLGQVDVACWGFGFCETKVKEEFENVVKLIRDDFFALDDIVEGRSDADPKPILTRLRNLIKILRTKLNSVQANKLQEFGLSLSDLQATADVLEAKLDDYEAHFTTTIGGQAAITGVITGMVVSVYDGDTPKITYSGGTEDFRLEGYDAPEINAATEIERYAAIVARDALAKLILGKEVEFYPNAEMPREPHGRPFGVLKYEGQDVYWEVKKVLPSTIKIRSSPSQASVYLSGRAEGASSALDKVFVGFTGATIQEVPPGTYTATLRKDGYKDKNIQIQVPAAAAQVIDIPDVHVLEELDQPTTSEVATSKKSFVSVAATPEENLYIFVDDIYQGKKTPALITVEPGSHTISLSKVGYIADTSGIIAEEGKTHSVVIPVSGITPEPEEEEISQVNISSEPSGAQITLDGELTGRATPSLFNLPPGAHQIILQLAGYLDEPYSFTTSAGSDKAINLDMRAIPEAPLPVILIDSTPEKAKIYIDSLPTGKTTPQYFEIQPGRHLFRVELSGYKPAEAEAEIPEV